MATAPLSPDAGFPIVALGASAGGLEAFEAFFGAIPADSGMAFVLVAHLDPRHVSILPELLQKRTGMKVRPVVDGIRVVPNVVYVIPPNKELGIIDGVLQLFDLKSPRGVNMPIDGFFRSLAQDQGSRAIGIVLSGTGSDGTLGLRAIKGEAGMVMIQDEESAKYEGMPRSAIATQLADFVLPPREMPAQLIEYAHRIRGGLGRRITPTADQLPDSLQKIFLILRDRTGHDFSLYKKNTLCRRIERRMHVQQIDSIADYLRYLQASEREAGVLFKELLIGVTSFFRDPLAFDLLRDRAIVQQLADEPEEHTYRVWAPGCATGEEAYSIAMVLQEVMERTGRHFSVQIFGTDIDEEAINVARAARFPPSISADVGPDRMKRFFIKEDDGHFRVKKAIREMLIFAPQNIIKDPPFTKLDLLSCRNLLIYLGPELQKKLLPTFHFSLRDNGLLLLGSSETVGQNAQLFAALDTKWKLFRRVSSSAQPHAVLDFPTALTQQRPAPVATRALPIPQGDSALDLVESILRQTDTPPCAVVDEHGNVVYIHGRTGRYLEPPEGRVSVNIVEMARPGLKHDLADALRKVLVNRHETTCSNLEVRHNGGTLTLEIVVKPMDPHGPTAGLMMVVFYENPSAEASRVAAAPESRKAKKGRKNVEALELELQSTRENLQTTIEELETSNEELKSTNEELQSTNEELQSTNEEMETSKEELQSLNEESATVNAELQSRIEELSKANDDMKNLLDSTDIATVFLDVRLCVRRFTSRVTDLIPLTGGDTGRPIGHFANTLVDVDLTAQAKAVLDDLVSRELNVQSRAGRIFRLRVKPYRTMANVIDGVVMTFEDVTQLHRHNEELTGAKRAVEEKVRFLTQPMKQHVMLVGLDNIILFIAKTTRDVSRNEAVGDNHLRFVPQEYHRVVSAAFRRVRETGCEADYDAAYCPSGTLQQHPTRVHVEPLSLEGEVVAFVVSSEPPAENDAGGETLETKADKQADA